MNACAHCGEELAANEPEVCSFCFTAHVRGLPVSARIAAREKRAEAVVTLEEVAA